MIELIIAVVGMPGAGKGLVADEMARSLKCPIIRMGDVIRHEARRRGLEPTDRNLGRIMLEMRRRFGPAAVAERCLGKLATLRAPVVVVDGIRSYHEVEAFKRSARHVVLVAVFASTGRRFERLYGRERADDPKTWEAFRARDERELGVGLGSAMAMADYMVLNEGEPGDTRGMVAGLVRKIRTAFGLPDGPDADE